LLVERVKENYETEAKRRGTMELKLKKKKNKIFMLDEQYIMIESTSTKLQNQVNGYKIEASKLNKQINILQHQQEKYGIEASTAHARYYQTVEELKIKNNIIADLQKKNSDLQSKLKHQQNLYEAVRSDRNLYSKNLLEAQEEIEDLKKKFRRMSHQINQHKVILIF
jgi:predicted  nucleic acid-binding Zn-ribbon protein